MRRAWRSSDCEAVQRGFERRPHAVVPSAIRARRKRARGEGLLLAAFGLFSSWAILSAAEAPAPAALPEVRWESLGIPVKSARVWTSALAPNPRGGFNLIFQTFNSSGYRARMEGQAEATPCWSLVDLETGKVRAQTELQGVANSLYHINNQIRSANGRIFFPVSDLSFVWYDPVTETLKQTPPLAEKAERGPSFFYRVEVGPDGLIYATTQSNDGYAYLAILNPDTLETRWFPKLGGKPRKNLLTYGFWMQTDPPWVYLSVGQGEWALIALNTATGEQSLLAERKDPYLISFNSRGKAICATITSPFEGEPPAGPQAAREGESVVSGFTIYYPALKKKAEYFFCREGKLIPAPFTERPDFPIAYTPVKVPPLEHAPEFDLARFGSIKDERLQVFWRPANSAPNREWKCLAIPVGGIEPIPIESLSALPDGTLLGSTIQYNGFFRWFPKDRRFDAYGKHGPSRAKTAIMNGLLWITGYPKSHLWVFDPTKPWNATGEPRQEQQADANPRLLGNFHDADAHYPYFLLPHGGRQLYMLGRRERSGAGSAIGRYDAGSNTFIGHHQNLHDLFPRGLVILPEMNRIVMSGEVEKGKEGPTHVVFDMDLREIERLTIKPGLANGGDLYPGATRARFIGRLDQPSASALYLYDLGEKRLIQWMNLEKAVERLTWRSKDARYWGWQNGLLITLDPSDLTIRPIARMEKLPERLVWQEDILYATVNGELFRLTFL